MKRSGQGETVSVRQPDIQHDNVNVAQCEELAEGPNGVEANGIKAKALQARKQYPLAQHLIVLKYCNAEHRAIQGFFGRRLQHEMWPTGVRFIVADW